VSNNSDANHLITFIVAMLDSGGDFRVYISQCPNQYFGWRVYGTVKVTGAGDYTFCTTSDDGSLFYMDLSPSLRVSYTLLIDNDGLHGPRQYCKAVTLAAGSYNVKVCTPIPWCQNIHFVVSRLSIFVLKIIA
jgi:hypothetical protein